MPGHRQRDREVEHPAIPAGDPSAWNYPRSGKHANRSLELPQRPVSLSLDEARHIEIEPVQAGYNYVHAVGLHSAGHRAEAIAVLTKKLVGHPNDRDALLALISFSRDAGDSSTALEYAEQLAKIEPANPE